jgi:hypothetical protein
LLERKTRAVAIWVRGDQLRRKPDVAEAISKRSASVWVSRTKILEEGSRLPFSNIGDVLTIEDSKPVVKNTPPWHADQSARNQRTRRRPVEVDHTVDHSACIRSRLDEIAKRLPAPLRAIDAVDVTPARQASPGTLWRPVSKGSVTNDAR